MRQRHLACGQMAPPRGMSAGRLLLAVTACAVAQIYGQELHAEAQAGKDEAAAAAAASAAAAEAADEADLGSQFSHGYWKRDLSYKDVDESDFKRDLDPRLKQDGEMVVQDELVPKFRWAQDKRQVFVTIMVKNLGDGKLSVDDQWLNYSAIGDIQRVVTSHHYKQESQSQLSQKAPYGLQLPLKFKVDGNRTRQQNDQGYTTFVLRKATKGKEWKHLLKEPALTTYKKQHRIDWKKYDIDKNDDEFLVTKVNQKNLVEVVGKPGIVLMQFCPSWSSKAGEWAKQFGGAADILEDDALLAKVNVLTEADIATKYGISLSQRDENPTPEYAVFVGGVRQELSFEGETNTDQIIEFIRRLNKTPVTELVEEAELSAMLKTWSPAAIAIGMPADGAALDGFLKAARHLQIVGQPVLSVGNIAAADSPAAASLAALSPEIAIAVLSGPAILLLQPKNTDMLPVAEQQPGGISLAQPPIVLQPAAAGGYDVAELTSSLASWGYKAHGIGEGNAQVDKSTLANAQKLGVDTLYLHLKESHQRNESKLCPECPAAVAEVKALLATDALGFRAVAVSGGHIKGSAAQELATSHGLDGSGFPAVSLLTSDGRRYALPYGGPIGVTDLAAFLDGVKAGQVPQSLKSEPSPLGGGADPGSGRVEKVVGMNLLKIVRNAPEGVDCVLAIHNDVDRKSFKKNLETVAEKLAHVPTLTFGSFDVDKNELPAELDLGQDANKEGIWIFKAGGGAAPVRAKRKAKLGEIAKWIKKSATIAFEAKAPPLPEGTYTESCTGCRVHKLAGTPTKLICSDCPGGEGGDVSLNMAECLKKSIKNIDGELKCPELMPGFDEFAKTLLDDDAPAEAPAEAPADKQEL